MRKMVLIFGLVMILGFGFATAGNAAGAEAQEAGITHTIDSSHYDPAPPELVSKFHDVLSRATDLMRKGKATVRYFDATHRETRSLYGAEGKIAISTDMHELMIWSVKSDKKIDSNGNTLIKAPYFLVKLRAIGKEVEAQPIFELKIEKPLAGSVKKDSFELLSAYTVSAIVYEEGKEMAVKSANEESRKVLEEKLKEAEKAFK